MLIGPYYILYDRLDEILNGSPPGTAEDISTLFIKLTMGIGFEDNSKLTKLLNIKEYLRKLWHNRPDFFSWRNSAGNLWIHDLIERSANIDPDAFKRLFIDTLEIQEEILKSGITTIKTVESDKTISNNTITTIKNDKGLDIFELMCQKKVMEFNTTLSQSASFIIGLLSQRNYQFCYLRDGRYLSYAINPYPIKTENGIVQYYHLLPDLWRHIPRETKNQLDSSGYTIFHYLIKNSNTREFAEKLLDMGIEEDICLFNPSFSGNNKKLPIEIYQEEKEILEERNEWSVIDDQLFDSISEKIEILNEKWLISINNVDNPLRPGNNNSYHM